MTEHRRAALNGLPVALPGWPLSQVIEQFSVPELVARSGQAQNAC